jgi:hypothetical protein
LDGVASGEFFVAVGAALDIGLECWILGLAFLQKKKKHTSCDFLVMCLLFLGSFGSSLAYPTCLGQKAMLLL